MIMRSLIFAMALMTLPAQAHSLLFRNGSLQADVTFEGIPAVGHDSPFRLQFRDADSRREIAIEDQIKVILWMPSMGHGSSPTKAESVDGAPGLYRVSRVFFSMGGLWEVRVQLKSSGGAVETRSFTLEL